jgi:nucleoside-diphosphate-sugar epimerase
MTRRCALTGASGYVGGAVETALSRVGWTVVRLLRSPQRDGDVPFQLGSPVEAPALHGVDALIHCAYDATDPREAHRRNVGGSIALFEEARRAGIHRRLFVSTVSAFEGCPSRYGHGKLEVERAVTALGAISVRPGLVWGGANRGVFGALCRLARLPVLPVFDGGIQPFVLAHVDDVAAALVASLDWDPASIAKPAMLAHPQLWPFKALLQTIGRAQGRSVRTFSFPGSMALRALRVAEWARLPLPLRSDNLLGLLFPSPDLAEDARAARGGFRRFGEP